MLCSEIKVFGTAKEDVHGFGAVFRFEPVEVDLVFLHEVPGLHPQLLIHCQQIDSRQQRKVFPVELADRLVKHLAVFLVFEVHGVFLAFYYELIEPSVKSGIVNRLHCFCDNFGSACRPGNDPFLNTWTLPDSAFSIVVTTESAIAHLCREFKTMKNHNTAATWPKIRDLPHHSLEG